MPWINSGPLLQASLPLVVGDVVWAFLFSIYNCLGISRTHQDSVVNRERKYE